MSDAAECVELSWALLWTFWDHQMLFIGTVTWVREL